MKLQFDFLHRRLLFNDPIVIIQTHLIEEVQAKLIEVEQWTATGYYAAGFLSYEAAAAFHDYYRTAPASELPLLWFAICETPQSLPIKNITPQVIKNTDWQINVASKTFEQHIAYIKQQIAQGNSYQTNYTVRLTSQIEEDPEILYQSLMAAQQASYSAYLDIGRFKILSASPELFFHRQGNNIYTKPMKGTAARGKSYLEDEYYRTLLYSDKNKAENVMIVDLLRNDLSQIAQAGSVQVNKLFEAERYPTVWQLTSTISAKLIDSCTINDIFTALFPCGSITGAPKASTMQIIADLEPQARGIYCGTIGYITPQQEAIFNVPIRTLLIDSQHHHAEYGIGSGITWDSTAQDEYQEILQKSKILQGVNWPSELLESLLLEQGNYYLLNEHLMRLKHSAAYFNFPYSHQVILDSLQTLARSYPNGRYKVRLLLAHSGSILLTTMPVIHNDNPIKAQLAPFAMSEHNILLYHKTTCRDHYPTPPPQQEYLLYNQRGELTEFVNGNVVFRLNDRYITPSLTSGLLPGTMREKLLKQKIISEAIIKIEQLSQINEIIFINSVRKWHKVSLF